MKNGELTERSVIVSHRRLPQVFFPSSFSSSSSVPPSSSYIRRDAEDI